MTRSRIRQNFGTWAGLVGAAIVALTTTPVWAFPAWMGVYGETARHDGANPGTFSVLMNQDYVGLHAEVGVQVDGGAWYTLPMNYAGNLDGNSVWQATPDSSFPGGATISYYFHGWDDWGGNIWDSDGGNNYSFTAAVDGGGLAFGAAVNLGFPGPGLDASDAYVSGDRAVVVAGNQVKRATLSNGASAWSAWIEAPIAAKTVALNGQSEIIAGVVNQELRIYPKMNDTTWSAARVVTTGETIHSADATSFGPSSFAIAFTTSPGSDTYYDARKLWVTVSHDNGAAWSAPILVEEEVMGWYDSLEIEANAQHLFLKSRYVEQVYSTDLRVAVSDDAGDSWSTSVLFGDKVGTFTSLEVTEEGAFAALDPYYDNKTRLARYTGSGWETLDMYHSEYASGREVLLSEGEQGDLLMFRREAYPGTGWTVYASDDHAVSWVPTGNLQPPEAVPTHPPVLKRVLSEAGRVHLLWVNGDWRYGSNLWQTSLNGGDDRPAVEWLGNAYHWPSNGEIEPGETLWFNIDTYPMGAAALVALHYSVNGGAWEDVAMFSGDPVGENDHWYYPLPDAQAGAVVEYKFEVIDLRGDTHWADNDGLNYLAEVNGQAGGVVSRINDGTWVELNGTDGISAYCDLNVWIDFTAQNLGAPTSIGIVWTDDGWQHWEAASAQYEGELSEGAQQWGVDLVPAGNMQLHRSLGFIRWWGLDGEMREVAGSVSIEYAIFYEVNGEWYWDNNDGANYSILVTNPF